MMTSPHKEVAKVASFNPDDRAALIDGLLSLACFLEARPDVPAPRLFDDVVVVHVFPDGDTDTERRAVVDSTAAALGVTAAESRPGSGHYLFSLRFGPVTYCMVTISAEQTAETARALDAARPGDSAQVAA
jgi:hypothetical protein